MDENTNDERIETMVDEVVGIGEAWLKVAGTLAGTAIEAVGEGLRGTLDALERLGTTVKDAADERH